MNFLWPLPRLSYISDGEDGTAGVVVVVEVLSAAVVVVEVISVAVAVVEVISAVVVRAEDISDVVGVVEDIFAWEMGAEDITLTS